MEVPESKSALPMAARDISTGGLGGDTDAGPDAEKVPPSITAHAGVAPVSAMGGKAPASPGLQTWKVPAGPKWP